MRNSGIDAAAPTSLHRAASEGALSEAQKLLAEGADPNAIDHYGDTPLHRAAAAGHLTSWVSTLLNQPQPVVV
jgi:ankyrin repeat protein